MDNATRTDYQPTNQTPKARKQALEAARVHVRDARAAGKSAWIVRHTADDGAISYAAMVR